MKNLIIGLLFASAFAEYDETQKVGFVTPEELEDHDLDPMDLSPKYRRRLGYMGTQTTSGYCDHGFAEDGSGFEEDFCDLMERTREAEAVQKLAKEALGECEEEQPKIIFMKRAMHDTTSPHDLSWVYITDTPQKAFNGMVDFLRDQHMIIDDNHPLEFSYTYKTRDGKSRKLIVKNDMDLYSAIQLQMDHDVTELDVSIATVAPSSQPTTGHPSRSPTISQAPSKSPTASINTLYMPEEAITWVNSILATRKKMKIGSLMYRASTHGKAASYFHKQIDGKGRHLCMFKRSKVNNVQIFGSYSDISWSSSGGYGYCSGCFIWLYDDGTYQKFVSTTYRYAQYAVYRTSSYGPCFGGGHDFCVNSPSTPYGYTNWHHTYKSPKGSTYYIGGSSTFYMDDWECYAVVS